MGNTVSKGLVASPGRYPVWLQVLSVATIVMTLGAFGLVFAGSRWGLWPLAMSFSVWWLVSVVATRIDERGREQETPICAPGEGKP